MPVTPARRAIALSDGRAGVENQALGLAEAVARLLPIEVEIRRIRVPEPWRRLPAALAPSSAVLQTLREIVGGAPPDLLIGCGRQATLAVIAARALRPAPFRVQLQRPRVAANRFDLVIAPAHDDLEGPNVVSIIGATGRLTRAAAAAAATELPEAWRAAPGPRLALLAGGPSRARAFSDAEADRLAATAARHAAGGWTVLATTSRRSPPGLAARLRQALCGGPHLVFDAAAGEGVNPYPGMLALADATLVTADSVNLASEAATAGASVHIFSLPRKHAGPDKFDRFHEALIARGAARPWREDGPAIAPFDAAAFDETARAATILAERWENWRAAPR